MKKFLVLAACLCGFIRIARSQPVPLTQRDLIGNWQLVAFNTAGIFYDFDKDSLSLSDKQSAGMNSPKEQEFIANIKSRFQPYKEGNLIISTDNKYVLVMTNEAQNAEGTYKLVSKEGEQYVTITKSDNQEDEMKVWKDKDRICFDMPCEEGGNAILIFKKH